MPDALTLGAGIHPHIAESAYHADPCPEPSLSASIAKMLVSQSPLHAWTAHPRLNPAWQSDESSKAQDIGSAAHALLLGVGRGMEVIKFKDYRSNAAKDARDAAREAGKVPVLEDDAGDVRAMVLSARQQLAAHEVGDVFDGCMAEQTMVWRDDDTWCRARIDCLPADFTGEGRVRLVDYKTSSGSAEPDAFTSRLYGMDGDIQAAFYERGILKLYPAVREVEFLFIAQETKPPYGLSVVALSNKALDQARERVEEAFKVWRTCIKADRWPGYVPRICRVDPPGWQGKQHEERKILGTTPSGLLKVAMDWQAPHRRTA
ncbi:MAG: PD-(D/E)XK nuclease-like domain-containing protein [Alphaproteobacteria bacterium]|nr:PD-(D/E)XK nuclease-like domain-containing protein [Alphaproteobacteria bacterium]MCW5739633.1 PD-(D/E)XK nuclease-like domain-containing protein [Alphaproteobacteria bacterium]